MYILYYNYIYLKFVWDILYVEVEASLNEKLKYIVII